ncbi:MAG: hypothetical protein ACKVQJ_10015 [Pyrinomonadaceae bacterium]
MKLRWRFGIIAGLFLAIFSLYPQFNLMYNRGSDWNGHYAYNDIDEVAYASYLKALIDGRPRKNDPYTGRDDSPENPQPESLFSIQFAGPYTIAIPARIFGIPATWAMTISGAVAAFLTALAIFWLIGMITGDSLFPMAASLFVLAGGALFAGEGAIGEILGTGYSYPYFPGFRRYVPAMAFPAFFALIALVWKVLQVSSQQSAVSSQNIDSPGVQPAGGSDILRVPFSLRRPVSSSPLLLISLSALAFCYTVFSYFYVWTTAAAWMGSLGILWLIVRPDGVWKDIRSLFMLGVGCILCLLPYAYLLSKRSHTMDEVQMLVRTHAPDLTRMPELIGFLVLAVIAAGILLKVFSLRDKGTLFAISLALTPIIVFNQQVITGQSLQPIHYQVFIGNYVAGLAVVMTLALLWRKFEQRETFSARAVIACLGVLAASWGFVECFYTVRVLDDVNVVRDEALPVARRLTELAKDDPDPYRSVVLNLNIAEADDQPTVAPQAVLWSRHQHVFAGVTWQENKERYYQQLYYSGVKETQLSQGIKHGDDIVSLIALFGWGRHTDRLNSEYKPLTLVEVDDEARRYGEYIKAFDAAAAGAVRLSFLVAPAGLSDAFLENIDKWYERYDGEIYGKYTLYKLRLR